MPQTTTSHESNQLAELTQRMEKLEQYVAAKENRLSMVVFSGELDKLLAAFTIATGAAACGIKVSMFFTFWATAAMKKKGRQVKGKTLIERMFGWMLPGGFNKQRLSRMEMAGIGRQFMFREMKRNKPGCKRFRIKSLRRPRCSRFQNSPSFSPAVRQAFQWSNARANDLGLAHL